jgi:predicted metal-dependent hydrolase
MDEGAVAEAREFLAELKRDLPELFEPPKDPREHARERFLERTAFWAPRLGVAYKRVFIKDQRTLWGSCSREGNLNFNWRIAKAPPEILDYLVIHELAHLREMNHSPRFWAVVAEHCPDYKVHRKWLRLNAEFLKKY